MKGWMRVAQTEVLEHRRQPWMLTAMAAGYALVITLVWVLLGSADSVASDPAQAAELSRQLKALGVGDGGDGATSVQSLVGLLLPSYLALLTTNMPIFVAYFAGYSMIHDRENGVLPFVLLSPLSRGQLLLGKLLGIVAVPLGMHLVGVSLGCLPLLRLPLLEPYGALLGGGAAWWLLVLLVTPSFALFIGALGTVVSSVARDVRASMQIMSLCFWLLSLAFNMVVVYSVSPEGVGQLALFAVGCLAACGLTLAVGSRVMSRDLSR